ncbi:MAG: hypothetical protein ACH255_00950 [Candidatus Thiodiazotropha sp.]
MRAYTIGSSLSEAIDYDRESLCYLKDKYGDQIDSAISELKSIRFEFNEFQNIYISGIDRNLAFRQGFPICIAHSASFNHKPGLVDILTCYFLGQTMILNHIDRHLDLSSSYTINDPKILLKDVRTTMCYSVGLQYAAAIQCSRRGGSSEFLSEMYKVSSYIIQSMYQNYIHRFQYREIENIDIKLNYYLNDKRSPLFGSGFYESGIRGCFAFYGEPVPNNMAQLLRTMRIFRQRVDQLADYGEDLATGMLTYPTLMLLKFTQPDNAKYKRTISDLWQYSEKLLLKTRDDASIGCCIIKSDTFVEQTIELLSEEMKELGVWDFLYQETKQVWELCKLKCATCFTDGCLDLELIIDLKMAFLDRLRFQNWKDIPVNEFIFQENGARNNGD